MQSLNQKKVRMALNINTKKLTHAGRTYGAQALDLAGVEESSIRRQGRWNNDIMTAHYFTNLPQEAMLGAAGFYPKESRHYYITRAESTPPNELIDLVFTELDHWLQRQETRTDEALYLDKSLKGFLGLLRHLRMVLLQDAPLLQQIYPNARIWQNAVFQSDIYRDWAQRTRVADLSSEEPIALLIQRAMPGLADTITTMNTSLLQAIDAVRADHERDRVR